MAAGSTFDIERAGFSGGTIGVERIAIRLLIILVARKLPACTHADHLPARPNTFAARRAVGIERAGCSLRTGKRQRQSSKPIFRAHFFHGVTTFRQELDVVRQATRRFNRYDPGLPQDRSSVKNLWSVAPSS